MAKINSQIKEGIGTLSKKDLEKLVLRAASMNKQFHDYLIINYFDKSNGEKDLFEKAKNDLEILFRKPYKGFSEELVLANMLAACGKRINEFSRFCKDKSLEMDLIMITLEIPFSISTNHFATCFTRYNYQVYVLVKKAMGLLRTRLHEDYYIQYAAKLNNYLEILHRSSSHLDYVYGMPKSV